MFSVAIDMLVKRVSPIPVPKLPILAADLAGYQMSTQMFSWLFHVV